MFGVTDYSVEIGKEKGIYGPFQCGQTVSATASLPPHLQVISPPLKYIFSSCYSVTGKVINVLKRIQQSLLILGFIIHGLGYLWSTVVQKY